MTKAAGDKQDKQLVVRVSGPLRTELEAAAQQDCRPLSSMVRRVLIGWLAQRGVIERDRPAA
jgi:hypothetical protein